MPIRPTIFLFCALLVISCVHGEEAATVERLFRNWATDDGLPNNRIRALARTRDGFLWLGTDGGLARFDGVRFETYGLREGLVGVEVLALLSRRDGSLWVGTIGHGISEIRDGRVSRNFGVPEGIPGTTRAFAEDAQARVWVSSGDLILRFDHGTFAEIPKPDAVGRRAPMSLYCDRRGTIWGAFGNRGLYSWDEGRWARAGDGAPESAGYIVEDAEGSLCVAENMWLWRRETPGWRRYPLPPEMAQSYVCGLTTDDEGTVWLAVAGGGVCGFRDGNFLLPKPRTGTFDAVVDSVLATDHGQLWLGTYSDGIYALSKPRTAVVSLPGGEIANHVTALLEMAPGELAIGTEGRGFFRWREGVITKLFDDPGFARSIYGNAFLRKRDGSIWAASAYYLYEFRDGRRIPHPPLDATFSGFSVRALLEDPTDGLWVGDDRGVFRVQDGQATPVDIGTRHAVYALAQEKDGTLWIGTSLGLVRRRGKEVRSFGLPDGVPEAVIRALYVDRDDHVWVGSMGGGVAKRDGERFVTLTTREGLPDDVVLQITEDAAGRIWVGTNRGLAILEKSEADAIRLGQPNYLHPTLVRSADGLLSESCLGTPPVAMSDGRLAFATTRGVAIIRPDDFRADTAAPSVSIGRLFANGQAIAARNGKLTVSPGLEHLEIEYTGLYFAEPDQLRFRYRLEGLDRTWVEAGARRVVDYQSLTPGRYRFEVSASIGNGRWQEPPASLEIVLVPYWWQTWSFRVVAALIALATVGLLARQRERRRAEQRIRELERQHAVDAERSRIARDLHDDLGADLTHVALLSELAQTNFQADPQRAHAQINEIFTTAQGATRALDEIIWAANPANDTFQGFVLFLCGYVQDYASTAGLRSRFEIPENLPDAPLESTVRHELYLATKEALHNVVKHARASEIRFRVKLAGGGFEIGIEDNGRGFATEEQSMPPGCDGLANLQQRLERIGGRCRVLAVPGSGTTVEFDAPL